MVYVTGMSEECELFAYCGMKKNRIKTINKVVVAIAKQSEEELLDLSKEININIFYSYFGKSSNYCEDMRIFSNERSLYGIRLSSNYRYTSEHHSNRMEESSFYGGIYLAFVKGEELSA